MFSIITYFLVYFPIVKVAFILLCHIFVFSKQTPRFLIINLRLFSRANIQCPVCWPGWLLVAN